MLFGHWEAAQTLDRAIASGRMHHAWMLTGPRGVGKATLAYRAARRLLGAAPQPDDGSRLASAPLASAPGDRVCARVAAGSHGDLLAVERPVDDRGVRKAEIPVALARGVPEFFARTSGEGGRQICIIDAADELTIQGANAILKTLEEPPAGAVFFLIAHAPGRMPPTIASRCRRLTLREPGEAEAAQAVQALCGADEAHSQAAARATRGRPGEAVRFVLNARADLADAMDAVTTGRLSDGGGALAERLGGRDGEGERGFAFAHLRQSLHAAARSTAHGDRAMVHPKDKAQLFVAYEGLLALEDDIRAMKMDPKLAIRLALKTTQRALKAIRVASRGETT